MKYIVLILLMSNIAYGQSKTISVIVSDTINLKPIEHIYSLQAQVDYSEMSSNGKRLSDKEVEELYKSGYSNIIDFLNRQHYEYEVNNYGDIPSHTEMYNSEIEVRITPSQKEQFSREFKNIEYAFAYLSKTEYEDENRHYNTLLKRLLSQSDIKARNIADELGLQLCEIIEYKELVNETEEKILELFSELISSKSLGVNFKWSNNSGILENKISVKYSVEKHP